VVREEYRGTQRLLKIWRWCPIQHRSVVVAAVVFTSEETPPVTIYQSIYQINKPHQTHDSTIELLCGGSRLSALTAGRCCCRRSVSLVVFERVNELHLLGSMRLELSIERSHGLEELLDRDRQRTNEALVGWRESVAHLGRELHDRL